MADASPELSSVEAGVPGEDGQPPVPVDQPVTTAFAVGWQVGSIYRDASFDAQRKAGGEELPDFAALSALERTKLRVDLIEAGLTGLQASPAVRGIDQEPAGAFREVLAAGDQGDLDALRRVVRELHLRLLFALIAADPRLGKGYALGRELADISLAAEDRDSFDRAFGQRVVKVKNWLADLASTLPPHASRAVVLSLRTWEAWAAEPTIDGAPVAWDSRGAGVHDALRRQGELWRELLSGEKQGSDMLDTEHYLRAANALVGGMSSTLWRFLRPLALPLAAAIVLITGGLALLFLTGAIGQVVGAIVAAAGVVGITGAGIRARLGGVATRLQSRLWGAELDFAIAAAILTGPEGWGASIRGVAVPASGAAPRVAANLEVLRDFRDAVDRSHERRVKRRLAPDVEFVAEGQVIEGRDDVAEWVLRPAQRSRIAAEPRRVAAAGPSILVSEFDTGADVWRLQEGRVRRWQAFEDLAQARRAASLQGRA